MRDNSYGRIDKFRKRDKENEKKRKRERGLCVREREIESISEGNRVKQRISITEERSLTKKILKFIKL